MTLQSSHIAGYNPQVENGYLRIANEIVEALCRYRLSGEETQCVFVVFRKTYGFGKKEDAIPLSQFAAMTGLKRPHVVRALGKLVSKKVLSVTKKGTTSTSIYSFNKHFSEWTAVTKKDTTPRPASTNKDNCLLPIKVHSKESLSKEIQTLCPKLKKTSAPDRPQFDDFYKQYPKHKAKPAAEKAWNKLNPSKELFDQMMKALEWQRKQPDWMKENGQFIPLPASWLNGKRWLDEPINEQVNLPHMTATDTDMTPLQRSAIQQALKEAQCNLS